MYYERFLEFLTEAEIICNEEAIKMQSIHPYEIISDPEYVIQEAILSRSNINNALYAIMQRLEILIKQARAIAMKLAQKNKEWFETAGKFLNESRNISLEEYEIYDYLTGINRIKSMGIPRFESVNIEHFANDGEEFKTKAFKEVYVTEVHKDESGKETRSADMKAKAYFRGGVEKKKLSKNEILPYAKAGFEWLKHYNEFINKVTEDAINVNKSFRKTLGITNNTPINESTILHESLFKDEYYDILLEEALDPSDIKSSDEEEQKREKGTTPIDTNKEDNKLADNNKAIQNAVKVWYKVCSIILTAKIDICEEAYKAFVDMIDKLMNNTTKKDV